MHRLKLSVCSISLVALLTLGACTSSKTEDQQQSETTSKTERLRSTLQAIIDSVDATIGVAVIDVESGDTLTINGHHRYPMQSTYKFPLALAVLHAADEHQFSLDTRIHVKRSDMHIGTWSPLGKAYPKGDIDLTIAELIDYTAGMSDNNTCDILFDHMGGCENVEKYVRSLGVQNMFIRSTEKQMHDDSTLQHGNWCQPLEMSKLLVGLHKGTYLSDTCNAFLLKVMTETPTSARRIKGALPKATIVTHKTGTGDSLSNGRITAVNDVGIVALPNGHHIALSIYVTDSGLSYEATEDVIAKLSRIVYDSMQEP